jgi:hypothetical protein
MSLYSRNLDSRGMPKHPIRRRRRGQSTSFAAVLLLVLGVFHVMQGVAALASDGFYESPKGYFLDSDMVTTWGWAHLLLGVAAVAAGWALRRRAMWARGATVAVISVSMFANFIWIPYQPLAAVVLIALDIFVMWAAFADYDKNAPEGRAS